MNIYIGNLAYEVTEQDLRDVFSEFGEVTSAKIINDMHSGKSKGFGFVEMASREGAEQAIAALNGKDLKGRDVVVNEARPKPERSAGGGGGGRGGERRGGGGFGGGGGGGRGGYR